MSFPGSIPSYTGFTSGETLKVAGHASQHNAEQADIVALATKVGIGSATPASNTVLRGTGSGTSGWGQVNLGTDTTGTLATSLGGTGTTTSTGTGSVVLNNNPTLIQPSIADFTNADHSHANTSGGGQISDSGISGLSYIKLYNPYKFHAYRAGALTPTTGTVIVFDTEVFDTGSNYSVSTGKFTAPISGFYWFNAQLNLETSTINQNLQTLIYKNGARAISGTATVNMYNGATSIWSSVATGIVQLAATDYVTTVVLSDSEAMAVAGTGSQNFFQGFLISTT